MTLTLEVRYQVARWEEEYLLKEEWDKQAQKYSSLSLWRGRKMKYYKKWSGGVSQKLQHQSGAVMLASHKVMFISDWMVIGMYWHTFLLLMEMKANLLSAHSI